MLESNLVIMAQPASLVATKELVIMVPAVATIAALVASLSPAWSFVGPQVCPSFQVGGVRRAAASSSRLAMVSSGRVENVAAVLLAGGVGKRMEADRPKQLLELQGKSVLEHGVEMFLSLKGVSQLIVVLDKQYRRELDFYSRRDPRLVFADPGTERQDSVYNALEKVDEDASLVCIHDAARPLVTKKCVYKVIADAEEHGAAVLGVLMKATVKESEDGQFVLRTINRARLWDIQTPQVVKPDILRTGFEKVQSEGWEVTDDVSIVEQLGLPVKLTEGEYTNLKLTTPDDLVVASQILEARRREPAEDDDGDDDEEEESFSQTRANAVWSVRPRGNAGESDEEEEIELSKMRANEEWTSVARGNAGESEEGDLLDLSKMRAAE